MDIRQDEILRLQLPYRERLTLRRAVYRGGDGPRVAVVAGIHGDELEGLYVAHRVARWLEAHPGALQGQVELLPAVNPLGLDTLERGLPTHDVDLNRNFPGHADGLLPQRLAHAVMEALTGAALVVDIHASNIYLREIPQIRINQCFAPALLPLARSMNMDVIWLHEAATVLEATLAHSLNLRGVPCLVAELGVGMRVTPSYGEQMLAGLLATWQALGVIAADAPIPPCDRHPLVATDANVRYLNAPISGLFVPTVEHWTEVREGTPLGHIVSPFGGGVLAEVTAPAAGVLFTLREYPLVYEGSLMARIVATGDPTGEEAPP